MTTLQAVQMMQHLHNRPAVQNLTARQVVALKNLTSDDYRQIRSRFDDQSRWNRLPALCAFGCLAGLFGALAFWSFPAYLWLLIPAGYFAVELAERQARSRGYVDGYENGFNAGINRALGLTDEQSREISKEAVEAEVWEGIGKDTNALANEEFLELWSSCISINALFDLQAAHITAHVRDQSGYVKWRDILDTFLFDKSKPNTHHLQCAQAILALVSFHRDHIGQPLGAATQNLDHLLRDVEHRMETLSDTQQRAKLQQWMADSRELLANRKAQVDFIRLVEDSDACLPKLVVEHGGDLEIRCPPDNPISQLPEKMIAVLKARELEPFIRTKRDASDFLITPHAHPARG
jgi:hypothetical protein